MDTNVLNPAEFLAGESIVNNATVVHSTWEPGDVAHQGDLIFVCLKAKPKSAKARKQKQLAIGDTYGSRHILECGKAFDCNATEVAAAIKAVTGCDVDTPYIGPVFVGRDAHVDHPEHGPQTFTPNRCTAVVYQRSLDAEEREARVAD